MLSDVVGGTAGAVVANRLTEDAGVSVLVLEAGRSNRGIEEIIIPFYGPGVETPTDLFWNYTIVPQVGYNNRSFAYQRGRVLGGSSSVSKCILVILIIMLSSRLTGYL